MSRNTSRDRYPPMGANTAKVCQGCHDVGDLIEAQRRVAVEHPEWSSARQRQRALVQVFKRGSVR